MDNNGRLLIVDDELLLLKLMENQLLEKKYLIFKATSGEQALDILRKEEIHILITDLQMPGMNGIELVQEAVKFQPTLESIVVTGHGDMESAIKALQLGAINYFEKPVNINVLDMAINKGLEKIRLIEEIRVNQEVLAKVNRKLAKEINKSKMILNAAGEGIVGLDLDGNITFVNPAAELLLGWETQELIGRSLHDLSHHTKADGSPFPCEKCPVCAAREGNNWYQGTNELFWRKDGSRFPVSYISTPIIEENQVAGAVVMFSDITERKIAEEKLKLYRNHLEEMVEKRTVELEIANKMLQKDIAARKKAEKEAERRRQQLIQADKMVSLGILVAGVAHEINNPNNFIMMNAPLLRRAWEDSLSVLDNHHRENGDFSLAGLAFSEMREHIPALFSGIEEGSERIKKIVLHLKDYARQDLSDMTQDVAINEVLRAALTLFANPLKRSTNHLVMEYAEDLPVVKGNFQRIEQVLINVIQNACHALPDPSKGITITTCHDKTANRVVVQVSDQGPGIPAKVLKRIQDPFFTTKRDIGGTGLGLSISAGIMEEHGGELEFESQEGQGTTVSIALPVPVKS